MVELTTAVNTVSQMEAVLLGWRLSNARVGVGVKSTPATAMGEFENI